MKSMARTYFLRSHRHFLRTPASRSRSAISAHGYLIRVHKNGLSTSASGRTSPSRREVLRVLELASKLPKFCMMAASVLVSKPSRVHEKATTRMPRRLLSGSITKTSTITPSAPISTPMCVAFELAHPPRASGRCEKSVPLSRRECLGASYDSQRPRGTRQANSLSMDIGLAVECGCSPCGLIYSAKAYRRREVSACFVDTR